MKEEEDKGILIKTGKHMENLSEANKENEKAFKKLDRQRQQ